MKTVLFSFLLIFEFLFCYYFGKNKVQYYDKNWIVQKTIHFDIYIEKQNKDIGKLVADIAEEAIDKLSKAYQHELSQVIPIIIFSSSFEFENNNISSGILGESTGGFTEIARNRVVLPFNGKREEFRHVLIHELNHAFQFDLLNNQKSYSFNRFSSSMLWFMEGSAEYITLGLDPKTESYLRDGIIHGVLPTIEELENPYRLGKRYYYVYKGAQGFFYWLEKYYGKDKLYHFIHSMLKKDSKKTFEEVLGISKEEASKKWHFFLKKHYWKTISDQVISTNREAKQHTSHLKNSSIINFSPVFASNDHFFYMISNEKKYPQIVKYSIKNKEIVKVIASSDQEASFESINVLNNILSFDKTRKFLLFSSRSGATYFFNIYDVKKNKIIKSKGVNLNGVYGSRLSPNGEKVVFSGFDGKQVDLYLFDLKSGTLDKLTDDIYTESFPCWAPDSRSIVYACNKGFSSFSFKKNLYSFEFKTFKSVRLTSNEHNESYPIYSPDYKKLAFISEKKGVANIYIQDLKTKEIFQVTDIFGGISYPNWSYDGSKIIYTQFQLGAFDVFSTKINLEQYQKESFAVYENSLKKEKKSLIAQEKEEEEDILVSDNNTIENTLSSSFYKPSLSSDNLYLVLGGSSTGLQGWFFGQIVTSFSDILNDYRLDIDAIISYDVGYNLLNTVTTSQYLDTKNRINYGYYIAFNQYHSLSFISSKRGYVDTENLLNNYAGFIDKNYAFGGFLRYSFNKYNRVDLAFSPSWIERNFLDFNEQYIDRSFQEFGKFSIPISLSYTHDSTLFGFLHPIDNERSYASIEYSPNLWGDYFFSFSRVFLDFRKYLLVTKNSSLAMRFLSGGAFGKDRDKFNYYVGGGAVSPNYPNIRGYPFRFLRGNYMHLFNIEYRTTFLEFAKFFFPIPLFFGNINGIIFYDIGTAYNDITQFNPWEIEGSKLIYKDLKASFGVGLRWLFLIFPMKLDFSMPHTGHNLGKWNTFFFIGFDF